MRGIRPFAKACAALAVAAIVWGCSSANDSAPTLNTAGHHPAGWIVAGTGGDHPLAYLNNTTQCAVCHGSDLTGGISKVSCFSTSFAGIGCHPNGPLGHPTGFSSPDVHGAQAKAAVGGVNGFAFCQKCHGSDFSGGLANTSCFSCHGVNAPHSPKPWINTSRTHTNTDVSNAPVCAQCHTAGANLSPQFQASSYSTGTPGCFNNTLCHGAVGHQSGWRDPGLHGAAAKSQPGSSTGFAYCQICHGADFSGGVSGVSCFTASTATGTCHGVNAPHAPKPWRTYPSPTHTTTVDDAAGGNAAVCAICHTAGKNLSTPILASYSSGKPGCFNSTLCHGQMGHPAGWAEPSNHGAAAKANLTYCQQCHSDNPTGGPGSNPRFNVQLGRLTSGCETCHAPFAAHPRVLQIPAVFGTITTLTPIGTPWYLHCKVAPSGFDACNRCHGANLDGVGGVTGATGCTFCHRNRIPTTVMDCASCHGNPPSGTAYPDTAGVHASHGTLNVANVCNECHQGLGSITLDHFNRAKAHTTSLQAGAVVFGALASTGGLTPAYNATTQQCTNVYCHGNTLDKPATAILSPSWNAPFLTGVASNDCTKCHGYPPNISPHSGVTPTQCINCHPHVNASGTGFTDPTKHINGVIDASGAAHAFPYPGSVHLSAAGAAPFPSCLTSGTGCHTNAGASGANYPYPPATSVPPDCQGCHTKLPPGNSCGSCHGTASNGGRPNGTAFPDVAGQHSNNHGGFACSTCHGTAGTGQTTHGNSNFTLHNDANVVIQLPSSGNTMVYTRSGLGDGHGTCTGSCNGESHSARQW